MMHGQKTSSLFLLFEKTLKQRYDRGSDK